MGSVRVFLESGFQNDDVTLSAAGVDHEEFDVTTRYQVGLARSVELAVPDDERSILRITVGNRTAEAEIVPGETPYVRVNAGGEGVTVEPESQPPRYA
jgi:hypothetical protein